MNTVVIGGVTYVKLAELKTALTAQGGANAKASVSGCINEWLFNGIWRMRVTKVQPFVDRSNSAGWGVTVEIKNGTNQTLKLDDAGVIYDGAITLSFPDGNSWAKMDGRSAWQDKTYAAMPQGSGTVYEFQLFPESGMDKAAVAAYAPQKFLLDVAKQKDDYVKASFSVPDPSFRVDLTCKK
ncbi:hypothetical protein BOO71_0008464 [Deinococcus marmoris]|uniref:Uncharacterized protein n=1 Tax=Deinococcus marmoris TaxID=249408 RepID=A0A1U7NXJ0_9DEIO|nr:hypothetical protein BOO71_0008464 [Deinococcus marmoris]